MGIVGRALHADAVHGLAPDRLALGGDLVGQSRPSRVGPLDDLVVDVGDVRDVADLEAAPLEVAAQHVEHEREPAVAEVRRPVDGGAAHVHRHLAGLAGLERDDLVPGGVEQAAARSSATASPTAPDRIAPVATDSIGRTFEPTATLPTHRGARTMASGPRQADPRRPRGSAGRARGRPRAPTASTAPSPRRGLSRSTRRRPRSAARCTSATSSATPTPTPSPASSACGAKRSSTRWAGTTTACPPSAGSRTTTASAATRRCPTTPTSSRRPSRRKDAVPVSRPQLRRAVRAPDRRATSRPSRTCSAASACRSTGRYLYTTIDERSRPRQPARLPAQPGPRRGLPGRRRPTLWDVDFRTAVAQAELEDREMPGAYHRIAVPRGADGEPSSSRPPGPSCIAGVRRARRPSRRRALPAAVRHDGPHAAVRRRGRGPRPRAGRARQGLGHRHDLHVRRHHRRHLVARAPAADARRSSGATAASLADDAGLDHLEPTAGPRYAELAGKTVKQAQTPHRRAARASRASSTASPRPITHPVKFYEKGDRPLEIVTSRQWYIRNGGRDADLREALLERGPGAALAPDVHAAPLRELGRAASTATG